MADLLAFKTEVKELLKTNGRCDIDASLILKWKRDLTTEEEEPTAQDVYDKLIELHPEKKCFNTRKKKTEDEFINKF